MISFDGVNLVSFTTRTYREASRQLQPFNKPLDDTESNFDVERDRSDERKQRDAWTPPRATKMPREVRKSDASARKPRYSPQDEMTSTSSPRTDISSLIPTHLLHTYFITGDLTTHPDDELDSSVALLESNAMQIFHQQVTWLNVSTTSTANEELAIEAEVES